jgi:hypothetical protein
MTSFPFDQLRIPKGEMCYAKGENVPGFLEVETCVLTDPACVLTQSSAIHRVEITNYSLLTYDISVMSECKDEALRYKDASTFNANWPIVMEIPGRPNSGSLQPDSRDAHICASATSPSSRIDVNVGWQCKGHPGQGYIDRISIYVTSKI